MATQKRDLAEQIAYLTEKEWTSEELLATGEEIYETSVLHVTKLMEQELLDSIQHSQEAMLL
ncbi:MAG: hypothetical protein CM15mP31_2010 [Gammaproteobacteria bacterium]|nr:MAG: hypothetical protein CM15mP31_2010 [Gammaproteobacteria bacterium]